mgnify:CR=1 FL=1
MVYVTKEALEEMFAMPSASLSHKNLRTSSNASIDSEEKTEVQAFKKIERLVMARAYASRDAIEVRGRLEKDLYTPEVIDAAIARALRCGYLDDLRFADVLIRSRLRAGKGLAGIVSELKRHSINPEEQLPHFPDAYLCLFPSQKDSAIALLCKKPPRSKNKLQAAYAKLVRSGYSSSLASEAAREWYQTQE